MSDMFLRLASLASFAALLSSFLTARLTSARTLAVFDVPNARSLHSRPIRRDGGLAIVTSVLASAAIAALWLPELAADRQLLGGVLLLTVVIAACSFWDDTHGLQPLARLAVHIVVASAAVAWLGVRIHFMDVPAVGSLSFGNLAALISVLFLTWTMNLYNFMDGMDGFAAGMSVVGFGFLSALGFADHNLPLMVISILVAASTAGFFFFNFPPARIFMGDIGSVSLGLLAGVAALLAVRQRGDLWRPVLVFSPFFADATMTLLRRLARGEKVWRAHRQHWYQRLVLAGWSQRQTLCAEGAVMLACGGSALAAGHLNPAGQFALLLTWCIFYGAAPFFVRLVERTRTSAECSAAR